MKSKIIFLTFILTTASVGAQEFATESAAKDLIDRVSRSLSTDFDNTIREINEGSPRWVRGDLYPVVLTFDGVALASGGNRLLAGKNVYQVKDPDGKLFVKEYIDLTKTNGTSKTDFRVTNPVTKKIEPKTMFCRKQATQSGDVAVCAGIYKR